MIDIHSHVLFGIDDGAKNMEESLAMLRESKKQGVNTVFATPHFYAYEVSFDSYTSKVQSVYETLKCEAASEEYSDIKLGYEVRYFPGIGTADRQRSHSSRANTCNKQADTYQQNDDPAHRILPVAGNSSKESSDSSLADNAQAAKHYQNGHYCHQKSV